MKILRLQTVPNSWHNKLVLQNQKKSIINLNILHQPNFVNISFFKPSLDLPITSRMHWQCQSDTRIAHLGHLSIGLQQLNTL